MKNKKKISFIKLFRTLGLILILTASIAITTYDHFSNKAHLKIRTEQIKANYNTQQKKIIKDKVMEVVNTINYEKNKARTLTKKIIKSRVLEAHSIAENIYINNKSVKTEDEIKKMITDALRAIKYQNGSGYFYATDLNGTGVLFTANPELEGRNLINMQDTNGKFVIKDVIKIAKKSKEGFYEYQWTKPNEIGKNFKKISYIKLFKPYNLIIGTGLYLKDIENELEKDLLMNISQIRFGKGGYIFIHSLNGDALVSNGKVIEDNKKLWEVFNRNIDKMKKIFKLVYDAATKPNGDYIYYKHFTLSDTTKVYDKVSFVMGIPQFNWLIGTGVYLDDVEEEIALIQNTLDSQIKKKIIVSIIFILFLIIFFYVILIKISNRIEKDYNLFISVFKNNADTQIDLSLIKFKEFHKMARNANRISENLHSSEKRYKILFENNPVPLWEENFSALKSILNKIKKEGKIVNDKYFEDNPGFLLECLTAMNVLDVNKSTLELLKYKNLQDLSNNFSNIYNKKALETLTNGIIAIYNDKTSFSEESELLNSSGDIISVISKYQILDSYDKIILTTIDITPRKKFENALKESEKHFRSIIEQSPIAMQVFDKSGIMINANQAWENLWEIDDRNDYIGNYNLHNNLALKELGKDELINKVFLGEQVIIPETKYTNKLTGYTGNTRYIKFEAFPLKNSDGSFDNIVCFTEDISKQKQADKDLKKIHNLESIGTLAGGIAHDFNNILTGLFGSISMAKIKISASHPSYKKLENAEKSLDRATKLTKQLLTFAKGGAPIKESLSLMQIVKDTVNFDLSGSNVKATFDISENLWTLEADKGQIQQVFSNLAINADQAMENGGHLKIAMENIELYKNNENIDDKIKSLKDGKYIRITVKDEGTGIDNEKIEKIFDPYFTTKKTGSGLGLATVYSIIKRHGGVILLDSELGIGSTFTIYLPASGISPFITSDEIEKREKTAVKQKEYKILIMDDEEMILYVTKEMLEMLGFKVETVTDGVDAIEAYKKSMEENDTFDCILMDLTIPGGMGGKEAVKGVLDIDKNAKVIVSSGYASDPIMANYIGYGFKAVIEKPFTMEGLDEVITKVILKS